MPSRLIFPDVHAAKIYETTKHPHAKRPRILYDNISHFAARRHRTFRDHEEVWEEVMITSPEKQKVFLETILRGEWSQDAARMEIFIYEIEAVPSWLMAEFLRHRMIAREWTFEQPGRENPAGGPTPVINPFSQNDEYEIWHDMEALIESSNNLAETARAAGQPDHKRRYARLAGSETTFIAAGSAQTIQDLIALRYNEEIEEDNRPTPEFLKLSVEMFRQAQAICPTLFQEAILF